MDVQKNRAVKGRTFIILMAEKWLVVIFSKSGVHWQSYRARVTKQSLNHWLQKNATSVFYSRIKNSVLISGSWMLLNEGMGVQLVYVCAWNDRNIVNLLNLLNMRTWLKCLLFSMDVFSRSTIFFVHFGNYFWRNMKNTIIFPTSQRCVKDSAWDLRKDKGERLWRYYTWVVVGSMLKILVSSS